MARYLKDRRTGEVFGWNYDMSQLNYMKEVDESDADFNDGKPDASYVDPETGRTMGEIQAEKDRSQEALERATSTRDQPPPQSKEFPDAIIPPGGPGGPTSG